MTWINNVVEVAGALALVGLNGFFVAAEFALVKVRGSQITEMVRERKPFAKTAKWLFERLEGSLSACQLGITMASLALGWVGEPAFADLIEPIFVWLGVDSAALLHTMAFVIAFSIITSLHLVIGEQAPKIFAIRKPEKMILWCAAPMKFFYIILYPFLAVLNVTTSLLLKRVGLEDEAGHEAPHSEEEIRALLREAHIHGDLTRSEHRLINAVFEFDDIICRRVMVPRGEVEILEVSESFDKVLEQIKITKHTRYPLCDGSLDNVLGVVHMKDLLGVDSSSSDFDLRSVMREPKMVPESMPISQVLKHFQRTHQLFAFVIDEYGTIIGIVTLENVLECIIGPVDDEFDVAQPNVIEKSPGEFIVLGNTHILEVEKAVCLNLDDKDVDTIAGVLMARAAKLPEVGDQVKFDDATAEILEVRNNHAELIRIVKIPEEPTNEEPSFES